MIRRAVGLFVFVLISLELVLGQVVKPMKMTFEVERINSREANLIFHGVIQKNWHVYSQNTPEGGPLPMLVTFEPGDGYSLVGKTEEVTVPKKVFNDVFGVDEWFWSNKVTLKQRVAIKSDKKFSIAGNVDYQACIEERCIPDNIDFEFVIDGPSGNILKDGVGSTGAGIPTENATADSLATEKLKSEKDSSASSDSTGIIQGDASAPSKDSLWLFFWLSFLAGLIAILTPCVFPMIPMTVSFFMGNNENKAKAKFQAGFYGFSIILIYTVIGTIVAVTLGANFANWLSTHWVPNVMFFLIFVVFAASFFGMFEIVLPSWMVNKADAKADKGGISGAFFMAFTLVLVSFSCTGPLVGAILVQSAGGEVLEPIIGMFGFSLAFALPFTLFALFPSWLNSLPKSGGWLNSVKVVLGFVELALGLKFLSVADQTYHWGILDREIYIALWIVIFTLMGFYLLGKIKFAHDSEVKHIGVPRLMLVIATFSFVVYLIPGMFGAPLKFMAGYLPPQASHDFDIEAIVRTNSGGGTSALPQDPSTICEKAKFSEFLHLPHGLTGFFDYDQALKCAQKQGKPVFIDFTGHGCVNCREMEARVWADQRVLQRLREKFVVVALYVDDKTNLPESEWVTSTYDGKVKKTIGKKYADYQISRFNVNAQPYYVLLDTRGELLTPPQAYDLNADTFVDFLDRGLAEFEKRPVTPYEEK